MAFYALEKKPFNNIQLRARDPSRSCSLNRNRPGHVIETKRDRRNSFFESETIFFVNTPRSRANLTTLISENNARSLQENLARPAANQSACTIVAFNNL